MSLADARLACAGPEPQDLKFELLQRAEREAEEEEAREQRGGRGGLGARMADAAGITDELRKQARTARPFAAAAR